MTQTVDIYVNNVKVMTAVATATSADLATVADVSNLYGIYAKSGSATNDSQRGFMDWPDAQLHTKSPHCPSLHGMVTIQSTSGTNATGKSYRTRITVDGGSTTATLRDKHPFAD